MSTTHRPVYSTDHGRLCPHCGQAACVCQRPPSRSASAAGGVRVSRETKGRKGAGVTVVSGLSMTESELRALLSTWKKRLGCGGAVREGRLEFQGEHRDVLVAALVDMGIPAKKSGG